MARIFWELQSHGVVPPSQHSGYADVLISAGATIAVRSDDSAQVNIGVLSIRATPAAPLQGNQKAEATAVYEGASYTDPEQPLRITWTLVNLGSTASIEIDGFDDVLTDVVDGANEGEPKDGEEREFEVRVYPEVSTKTITGPCTFAVTSLTYRTGGTVASKNGDTGTATWQHTITCDETITTPEIRLYVTKRYNFLTGTWETVAGTARQEPTAEQIAAEYPKTLTGISATERGTTMHYFPSNTGAPRSASRLAATTLLCGKTHWVSFAQDGFATAGGGGGGGGGGGNPGGGGGGGGGSSSGGGGGGGGGSDPGDQAEPKPLACDPSEASVPYNATSFRCTIINGPAESASADVGISATANGEISFPQNPFTYPRYFCAYFFKGEEMAFCFIAQDGNPDGETGPVDEPGGNPGGKPGVILPPPVPYTALYPGNIDVSYNAETVFFRVCSNREWSLSADSSALGISPLSGDGDATVDVSVPANTGTASRLFRLAASSGDSVAYATVSQASETNPRPPRGPYLVFAPAALTDLSEDGANLTVTASTNSEFSLVSFPDWLSVAPESGKFKNAQRFSVSVPANISGEPRSGEMVFAYGEQFARIPVSQATYATPTVQNRILTPETAVASTGGTAVLYGTAKAGWQWTVSMADNAAFPEWLTPVKTSGIGEDGIFSVVFEVADFTADTSTDTVRSARMLVSFTDGDSAETASILLNQKRIIEILLGKPEISLETPFPDQAVPQTGGKIRCRVRVKNSEIAPLVSPNLAGVIAGWELVRETSDDEILYTYTFTVAPNETTKSVDCEVCFSVPEYSISVASRFTQQRKPPKALRILADNLFVADKRFRVFPPF